MKTLVPTPIQDIIGAFLAEHPKGEAYVVGGAVRDALLGRETKDIDVVITGVPAKKIEAWFGGQGRVDAVGEVFGVYKFLPRGMDAKLWPMVDIALPRTERATPDSLGGYRDFDTMSDEKLAIEYDLARRDFTMNAMAWNLRQGTLLDPFQGTEDLRQKLLRAVGNAHARFREDLSRILRGIRFAAELGCIIEPKTWLAMKDMVPRLNTTRPDADGTTIFVVPRETIGKELAKALAADPQRTLELLQASNIIAFTLPEIQKCLESDHTYLAPILARVDGPLPMTLALLLREERPERIPHILHRIGFTTVPQNSPVRVEAKDIAWMVKRLQDPDTRKPKRLRPSTFEQLFMSPRGRWLVEALETLGEKKTVRDIREREHEILDRWPHVEGKIPTLVSGDDVVAFGIAPGPSVRELLLHVRDYQLDGQVMTREEALHLLGQIARR